MRSVSERQKVASLMVVSGKRLTSQALTPKKSKQAAIMYLIFFFIF
jgi:hypothetical protein